MTAMVSELVTNPWMHCTACDGEVHSRKNGANMPCGHRAGVVSVCPTWEPFYGCDCDQRRRADAFQDALQADDERVYAERTAPPPEPEADTFRPTVAIWILFAVTVSLLLGAFATLGTGR